MAEKILLIDNFSGGISSGSKKGIAGSFRYGFGLDIHSDPDILQVQPATTKDSASVVVDLPLFGVNTTINSNIYFLGNAGKLYKNDAGSYSLLNTYTNAEGAGFFSGTGLVYFCSNDQQYTLDPSDDSITSYRALNSVDWHPIESFLDKVFTGNGRELVSTDASAIDYDSTTVGGGITIDYNYSIKCLKNIGNWLFIGCTSDNSSDARFYLWDGFSEDYNYARTLKGEDGINAVEVADDSTVLVFAGKKGNIYQLRSIDAPLTPLKTIPRVEKDKTIEIYPGSTANYQGNTLFGLSTGTSATVGRGVYSWASHSKDYNKALNFDFPISTETTTGTTLQIGAVLSVSSTDLYIGWRDGATYGIDKVDGTSSQGTTQYESLVHDDQKPVQKKHYKNFKIKLAEDLASGQVIDIYYKENRGDWSANPLTVNSETHSLDFSVDGAINIKTFKPDIKCYELELKFVITNAPKIDSLVVVFNDNPIT